MRPEDRVNQSTQPRRDFLLSCASNLHLAKSTIGKNTLRATARLLNGKSTAGVTAALASGGCLSESNPERPQKVWGRRGFSPGRFLKPRAITIDEQDRLYIVDTTGRIQVFDTEGNFLHQWKTPQTQNGRPTGLAFGAAQKLSSSTKSSEVQRDPDVNDPDVNDPRIFVADTHYYRMLSYTLKGEPVTDESIGGVAGIGPGEFAFVTDIACDRFGCRYIGEYNASDRIQKFDAEGNFLCQWGGTGRNPGSFVRPQSLVIQEDVLWVVDSCNHRIQRFDISVTPPRLIDIWGQAGSANGEFFYPYDLAIASDGSVVVIEYKNNRLQRFSSSGEWMASWGGPGFEPGKLNQPWGVVVDSKDRVHILDSNNHRIQRIELPA